MNKLIALIIAAGMATVTAVAQDAIRLSFPNTDVRDVLAFYERLSGCKIVADNQVVGPITVLSIGIVSKAEAIELMEQALFANGFSIIETNKDTLRIVGLGRDPRSEGIPLITRPEDIPTSERLISFVIKLQFRQPDEIIPVLRQHAAPSPSPGSVFVPDPTARAIIVTERSSIVRNLIKLVKEIDVKKHP